MSNAGQVAQSRAVAQVNKLFIEAFNRTVDKIGVSEDTADELVQSQLRFLTNFQSEHLPPDISRAFDEAVEWTSVGHDLARSLSTGASLVMPLQKFGAKELFGVAFIELAKLEQFDNRFEVKREIYETIISEFDNPIHQTFGEALEAKFKGRSNLDQLAANFMATFLISRQSTLAVVKDLMLNMCELGLICRSIFYDSIIDTQGKSLGKIATQRVFAERLADAPWEALSHFPIVGEFIGPIKLMVGLMAALADRGKAIDDLKGRLEDSYSIVSEFIEAYQLAFAAWAEWATKLLNEITNLLQHHLPAFQVDSTAQKAG